MHHPEGVRAFFSLTSVRQELAAEAIFHETDDALSCSQFALSPGLEQLAGCTGG